MKIVCGEENAEKFRKALKLRQPDGYALVRGLYDASLIDGLRGMVLETPPFTDDGVLEPDRLHCRDCRHWLRDRVGDGSGLGECGIGRVPGFLKWPKTPACSRFDEAAA